MQLLVTFKGLKTPSSKQDAELMQYEFEHFLQKTTASGSLIASGSFADAPGGFLIVEVESSEKVGSLVSPDEGYDFCITINHLLPFDQLVEHLELWSEAEQSYGLYGKI